MHICIYVDICYSMFGIAYKSAAIGVDLSKILGEQTNILGGAEGGKKW